MKKYIITLLAFFASLLPSKAQTTAFAYPKLPDSIKTVEQRASYLTLHYWDNFDFADTLQLQDANNAEQGFVNYIDLLARFSDKSTTMPKSILKESVQNFCLHAFAHSAAKKKFESLIEHYLENPQSPMRNDKTYLLFLQEMAVSPYFDETEKERIEFQLKTRNKNLPGSQAIDFKWTDSEGKAHRLSDYKNEKVILYFYDPDCDNCHKVSKWLNTQTIPQEYTFLSIHADIKITDLYSLQAMPTIYLLDKDNLVILKDCSPELLIQTINQK